LTQILGTALTETAGQIAAAFKKFFNIATPAATMDHGILVDTVTTTTTATNLTNLPAVPTDWLTAAGVKADAVTKIQTGLATPTNITAGTITTVTNLTNAPTTGNLTAAMKTDVENAVWNTVLASHLTGGSTGFALNAAGSAGDPWGTAIPGAYGAGTAGHRLGNIPDVAAGAAGGVFIAGSNAATTVNITGNLSGSVGSVTGAVGSVTAGVTVTTNNDKTGYALSAPGVQAIWDALTSALTTVGSIGKWIVDKLDVAVSTRGTGTALDAAGTRSAVGLASADLDTQLSGIQSDTNDLQTRLPAALTGAGNIKADAQVVSDKTGYTLSNTGMDNLLDRSNGVETGFTLRQALRLMFSALCGKLTGGNTTNIVIRDVNDTVDRITATVDANGNRSAVNYID
jgi:hypothetical protein